MGTGEESRRLGVFMLRRWEPGRLVDTGDIASKRRGGGLRVEHSAITLTARRCVGKTEWAGCSLVTVMSKVTRQDVEAQAHAVTGWKWPLEAIGDVIGRPEAGKNEDEPVAFVWGFLIFFVVLLSL